MFRSLLRAAFVGSLFVLLATAQQHAPRVADVDAPVGQRRVSCTIRWPNSFRNERNHDAAWVVVRGPDATRGPLRLLANGHAAAGAIDAELTVSEDRLGVFVAPKIAHRGDVEWRLTLLLEEEVPAVVTLWAIGMVFVPGGAFELGDDDTLAVRNGAFYRADENGAPAGVLRIEDEREIVVGRTAAALWYRPDNNGYHGDRGGPIPAPWPKGTRPFYVMKHELTQGEYASFLNALPAAWREQRAPLDRKGEETDTCSIERDGERVVARAPDRPCNFVSWDDTCAWCDWLGLRPMTEFEFEKAARGPTRPMAGDYPWGTTSFDKLQRRRLPSRDLSFSTVADEATLTDAERERHGASFYWVMDLAGSVWERVVSAAQPAGRKFVGSHGDGVLSASGLATNEDWPRTRADGAEADGVGFRGGADYGAPAKTTDATNPWSRTAARRYGGWGGAERYKTYSARGVRSAPAR